MRAKVGGGVTTGSNEGTGKEAQTKARFPHVVWRAGTETMGTGAGRARTERRSGEVENAGRPCKGRVARACHGFGMKDRCAARHENGSAAARIRAAGGVTDVGRIAPLSGGVERWRGVGSGRPCLDGNLQLIQSTGASERTRNGKTMHFFGTVFPMETNRECHRVMLFRHRVNGM